MTTIKDLVRDFQIDSINKWQEEITGQELKDELESLLNDLMERIKEYYD